MEKPLGGSCRPIPKLTTADWRSAFKHPDALIDEIQPIVEAGYIAVRFRLGDSPAPDLERVAAVRKASGDVGWRFFVDANTGYNAGPT